MIFLTRYVHQFRDETSISIFDKSSSMVKWAVTGEPYWQCRAEPAKKKREKKTNATYIWLKKNLGMYRYTRAGISWY